jgi:hypothetical protein
MKTNYFVLLTCLFIFACKQKTNTEKSKQDEIKKILKSSPNLNQGDGSYQIDAPDGWEKKENRENGIHSTIIFSPLENAADNFKDNVNVVTEKVPSQYDLDAYVNTSLANIGKYLTAFREINRSETTVNGIPARVINYNHNMQGYTFDVMVYLLLKNNIAYIITCSTKKGDMEKYRTDFQSIANSFKID